MKSLIPKINKSFRKNAGFFSFTLTTNYQLQTTNYKLTARHGFSLLELLLAIAMFAIFSLGYGVVITRGMDMNVLANEGTIANQFASEGIEAMRSIKNQNYALLVNTSATGVTQTGGLWILAGTSNDFEKYHRVVKIEAVSRNSSNLIVSSGGTIDPNTKRITSTVTWLNNSSRNETLTQSTYLTNWRITTTPAPTPTPPNWTSATISEIFDLTTANSGHSTADGLSIAYSGSKVYLGRTNSTGSEFYIFDVTNPEVPTILGRRDLNGSPNDIALSGNYAYIASTDNVSELQILDISDPATIANAGKLTTVDLTTANSGNNSTDALRVVVSGSYLYMVRNVGSGRDFIVFNLANPASPGAPIGRSTGTVATITDMVASGNYAYLTSTANSDEMQVIDVTVKTAPVKLVSFNLDSTNSGADALSVALAGSSILVGRASSSAPELYSIDISTPATPTLSSTMEVGFNVTEIAIDTINKLIFLANLDTSNELKIASYTSLTSLPTSFIKSFNLNGLINDFAYNLTGSRLFFTSADDSGEFQVVKPL